MSKFMIQQPLKSYWFWATYWFKQHWNNVSIICKPILNIAYERWASKRNHIGNNCVSEFCIHPWWDSFITPIISNFVSILYFIIEIFRIVNFSQNWAFQGIKKRHFSLKLNYLYKYYIYIFIYTVPSKKESTLWKFDVFSPHFSWEGGRTTKCYQDRGVIVNFEFPLVLQGFHS